MLRYWTRNRLAISSIAIILVTLIVSLIFVNSNISYIAKAHYEISVFVGSSIDFDVPSPSKVQVTELESLEHIEEVIPYIYTKKTVNMGSSNNLSNVGVLLIDNFDDIELTMYNSSRLIEENVSYSDNPLLVDYRFIKTSGLYLGDTVQIDFGGTLVSFTIDAIYETNTYYQSNTILGLWQGNQKTLTENSLGRELNYSGAYITSDNASITDSYLSSQYKPYGKLRDRSEFDTDESYQIHYNAFMTGDYSNEITSFANLLDVSQDKAENYKQVAQLSLVSGALLLFIFQASFSIALVFRKSEMKYFKYKKRIGSSYSEYYFYTMIFEIVLSTLLVMTFSFLRWKNLTLFLPIGIFLNTIGVLITSVIIASVTAYFGSKLIITKAS